MDYYLTPNKLFSGKKLPIECDTAILCFCPIPKLLSQLKIADIADRLFILLPSNLAMICEFDGKQFLVLYEIYGGPVTTSLVEELKYYGVNRIIGLGYAGSFNLNFPIATNFQVKLSLAEDGTSKHYESNQTIQNLSPLLELDLPNMVIWTTDAIYRETKTDVLRAKAAGCDGVNIDVSHFFASSSAVKIQCCYFGTISDMLSDDEWVNNLTDAVNHNNNLVIASQNQLLTQILDWLIKN